MDQPKIERLLRLMKMMSGNNNYTIEELAESLSYVYKLEEAVRDKINIKKHKKWDVSILIMTRTESGNVKLTEDLIKLSSKICIIE